MTYVATPTDSTKPFDSDDASGGAAELRALKGYLQTLIAAGTPITGYSFQGFRNKLINGNFDLWQRGTSLGSAVNNAFLADRWLNAGVGTTTAISQQAFVLGQTAVPFEPRFYHRTVVTSVAGAGNYSRLSQKIEGVRSFAGQTGTLSFWAKADAAKPIAIELEQLFGTGGSPSAAVSSIGVTKKNLTTAWQLFTVQVTVPSIAGKTLGTNNDDSLSVGIWFDAGSNFNSRTDTLSQQSGTFDIAQAQFEPGGSATPAELRPIGIETGLGQRFYRKLYGAVGQFITSTFATVGVDMTSNPMRATPAIAIVGTGQLLDPTLAFHTATSIQANSLIGNGGYIDINTSGATAYHPCIVVNGGITLGAEL